MKETLYDPKLFAELYDVHPQAIMWMKPIWNENHTKVADFEYTYCNDEGIRYLNISREQQRKGLRISNSPALRSPLREQVLKEMTGVYQTGEKSEISFYNAVLNKYARVLITKLRGGVLMIVQDRTEENRTIQQLGEQKRLLDNILQYSSNGISVGEVIRDEYGKVTDIKTIMANDAAVQFTGIPKEVYLTKTGAEIDPNFLQSSYFQMCVSTLETGIPFITQYLLETAGKWLEVSVSRMDEDRLIHIFTDVTPIKEAQLAIERSEKQLQMIINRTQSGILTLAPVMDDQGTITDFRFVLVNKALAAYVHQEPETLTGTLASKWFTAYMTNGLFALFCDSFVNDKMNRFDFHYIADGIDAWIDLMCTRYDGELLLTFTDYTPVKKLQLQLEQKVEELKQSNKNLESFAYASSHDLKEPIRKITLFSDKLKQRLSDQQDEQSCALAERIEKASKRMQLLIDDLLEYAHVSQGTDKWDDIDLNKKVRLVMEDLELTIQERNATIEVGTLPVVKGHRRQLQQLFQNLISNALKYSKKDVLPHVSITSRVVKGSEAAQNILPGIIQDKEYNLIEVKDNGIGFKQNDAERIFTVFTRLHGREEYSGSGVGLSIVKKVVENHNGYIWAESEPGVGATFKVLLPV